MTAEKFEWPSAEEAAQIADEVAEDRGNPYESWGPVDLTETLDGLDAGTVEKVRPTVLVRDDGRALLYPGRVNGIAGDSNGGKTWTALLASAQTIADGEHVFFVDFEDDQVGTLQRLYGQIGAAREDIQERFHYIRPEIKFAAGSEQMLMEAMEGKKVGLVVIDSTGESMALDEAKPNDDDDVARWFAKLPRKVARRTGAAVLLLDHVVKSGGNEGLWPIGSQRKRAAINGAQYVQRVQTAFNAERDGYAQLVCAKDRHGNYAQGFVAAELHVKPSRPEEYITLLAPTGGLARTLQSQEGDLMRRVSEVLEEAAEPMSTNAVDKKVSASRSKVLEALVELAKQGYAKSEEGARGAILYTSLKPYRGGDD